MGLFSYLLNQVQSGKMSQEEADRITEEKTSGTSKKVIERVVEKPVQVVHNHYNTDRVPHGCELKDTDLSEWKIN